jgi:hypothetical protein
MSFLNKKFLAGAVSLLLFFVFLIPIGAFALSAEDYTPLIQCGNTPTYSGSGTTTVIKGICTFSDAIDTINRIINWIISIAGVIFAVSCIYGGFLYMTSGDKPANKEKAKSILWNTLVGFVIILTAWVIVYTILKTLVSTSQQGSVLKFLKQ